jgi:hypothetical protein
MNFNKEETRNILNMLLSKDKENSIIAFSCLNNFSKKEHLGELLVLYQFGMTPAEIWEKNCKKGFKHIKKVLPFKSSDLRYYRGQYRLPSSKVFSELVNNKCSKESVELYLELFTNDFSNHLYGMGYPTDKLDIQIKIKE